MGNVLSEEFAGTAYWRETCAARFPHDLRNKAAVEELGKLQSASCTDPEIEARFQAMIDSDDPRLSSFSKSLHSRLAAIGFHSSPSTPDEVMLGIMEDLKYGSVTNAA